MTRSRHAEKCDLPTKSIKIGTLKPLRFKGSSGAAGRIRTADLILTNWLGAFQPLISNAFRPFLLQKDEVGGTLCSVGSVQSFPRVGQRVGQTARQ